MVKQMLVFNGKKWREAGGDVGDNTIFWEECTIVNTYFGVTDELLADVQWPDNSVTRGHIVSAMRRVRRK